MHTTVKSPLAFRSWRGESLDGRMHAKAYLRWGALYVVWSEWSWYHLALSAPLDLVPWTDKTSFRNPPRVSNVAPMGIAQQAGLQAMDFLVSIQYQVCRGQWTTLVSLVLWMICALIFLLILSIMMRISLHNKCSLQTEWSQKNGSNCCAVRVRNAAHH